MPPSPSRPRNAMPPSTVGSPGSRRGSTHTCLGLEAGTGLPDDCRVQRSEISGLQSYFDLNYQIPSHDGISSGAGTELALSAHRAPQEGPGRVVGAGVWAPFLDLHQAG